MASSEEAKEVGTSKVPDEIKDDCADKAGVLWASLRETDFHDGRNRIAALLRAALAAAQERVNELEADRDSWKEQADNRLETALAQGERAKKAESDNAALKEQVFQIKHAVEVNTNLRKEAEAQVDKLEERLADHDWTSKAHGTALAEETALRVKAEEKVAAMHELLDAIIDADDGDWESKEVGKIWHRVADMCRGVLLRFPATEGEPKNIQCSDGKAYPIKGEVA